MKELTDTTVKGFNNNKSKKVNSLRYNEYYDMQEMYDYIYQEGKNRIPQRNLMDAVLNPQNIMFAVSFGFRPNRSAKHAITEFQGLINLGRNYHVINIDIKGFFDNINHGKLLKQLWMLGIRDKYLINIISRMLKAEIEGLGIPTKGTLL